MLRSTLGCGGRLEKVKEECRDARRAHWIQSFVQNLRFSLRTLRKSPGFRAAVVLPARATRHARCCVEI